MPTPRGPRRVLPTRSLRTCAIYARARPRSGSRLPPILAERPGVTRRGSSPPWFRPWQIPTLRFVSPQSARSHSAAADDATFADATAGLDSLAAGRGSPRSGHGGRSSLHPEARPENWPFRSWSPPRSPLASSSLPTSTAVRANRPAPRRAENSIARSQEDHARASAVAALGVIGAHDPHVLETLVSLSGDQAPEVRMVVARTLGELGGGNPQALAALSSSWLQIRISTSRRKPSCPWAISPAITSRSCPILYRAYLSKERPLQEGAELSLEKILKSERV